jgi:hypothetical protein
MKMISECDGETPNRAWRESPIARRDDVTGASNLAGRQVSSGTERHTVHHILAHHHSEFRRTTDYPQEGWLYRVHPIVSPNARTVWALVAI